jgi:predicted MFS family arabinose efflux permease
MKSLDNQDSATRNSKRTIIAASTISASAAAIFLLMPLLIGVSSDELNLSSEKAGFIASSYFGGYLLICLSAFFWIQKVNWRHASIVGHALLILGVLFGVNLADYGLILTAFFIAGCGGGILFGICICILGETDDPDRYFGVKLTAEQFLAAILLFSLPRFVTSAWGFSGLGISLACVFIVLGFSTRWLPKSASKILTVDTKSVHKSANLRVWIGLVCLMIFMAGLTGVWAFIERMASSNDITTIEIGWALSLGVIGGGGGAFAAAIIGDRFGRAVPLLCSLTILSLVLFVLNSKFSVFTFTLCCIGLSGLWNYSLAYQMGIIASLDKGGRLTVLMSSALALGAMLGPAIAGLLISGDDFALVHLSAFVSIFVATIVFARLSNYLRFSD